MSKVRIYELAKELDISSKDMLNMLAALNIEVNSHMASIDSKLADAVVKQVELARQKVYAKHKKNDEQREGDGKKPRYNDKNRGDNRNGKKYSNNRNDNRGDNRGGDRRRDNKKDFRNKNSSNENFIREILMMTTT
ncbi:MAG: translation initiation factor IF-2 N-terminal domain-containing protein [Ezakiella coagulans]|uniref:translation initiation factor IF-2 N-terminal domain-containing protein n=1 Tax=Ezakiella coagulans TaxID=46507 RepID=UPI003999C43D